MENTVRLNKFIAANGISSRRKVDEMITQGRVTVNGETIIELGHKIDPETDKVALDGENIKTTTKKIYIILNKPQGVITTVSDEKHRTTVVDIVNIKEKIFPVGRLDYNTSGLLLLTNDGELANKLMHPKSEVYKTYFVTLSKPLEEKHRLKLEGGIELEGKKTANCNIRFEKKTDYQSLYISIYEGRNRQVRRMFEHYGYFVRDLERTEYAGLKLGSLKPGEWRNLTPEEVSRLNEIVKETPAGTLSNSHYKKSAKQDGEKKVRVSYDKKFSKRSFDKSDKSPEKTDSKKPFKKFGKRSDTDDRGDFKKTDKYAEQKDERKPYNKFEKRSGTDDKRDFKKTDKYSGKKDDRREFNKSGKRSHDKDDKKDYKKFDKRPAKKETKWGHKSRQIAERDARLGFKKPEDKFEKRKDNEGFKKSADRKDPRKDYKSYGKKDDRKDVKRDFKKGGKKNFKKRF